MINYDIQQDIELWHTYTQQIRECKNDVKLIDGEKDMLKEQYSALTDQESQDDSPISQKARPTMEEKFILEQQYQNVLQSKKLIQLNIQNLKEAQIKKSSQNINSNSQCIQNEESDKSSDFIQIDGLFSENSFDDENETYQITQQEETQETNQLKFQSEQQSQHLKWIGKYRNINLRYQKIQMNKILSQQDIDDILCDLDTLRQNKMLLWLQTEFNNLEHQLIYYEKSRINLIFNYKIQYRCQYQKFGNIVKRFEANLIQFQQNYSRLPSQIRLLKIYLKIDKYYKVYFHYYSILIIPQNQLYQTLIK
ncbi:hypothetical protein pb186bvf_005853 [Paramecium bursaria]